MKTFRSAEEARAFLIDQFDSDVISGLDIHQHENQARAGRRALILCGRENTASTLKWCWNRQMTGIPLDPSKPAAISPVLRTARPHIIIVDIYKSPVRILFRVNYVEDEPDLDPSVGLILFTSGSTGISKGVVLPRSSIISNAYKSDEIYDLRGGTHGTALSMYHCNAICGSLLACHILGTEMVLLSTDDLFKQAMDDRLHSMALVPALMEKILVEHHPWPDRLKVVASAAAPITFELASQWRERFGIKATRLRQAYGMTEATNFSLATPPATSSEHWDSMFLAPEQPITGQPLRGVGIKLVNEDDEGRCQLLVRGDLMDGYLGPVTSRSRHVTDGDGIDWFITGDIVTRTAIKDIYGVLHDGLTVVGRHIEGFNWLGSMTYPADIEAQWRHACREYFDVRIGTSFDQPLNLITCIPVFDYSSLTTVDGHPGLATSSACLKHSLIIWLKLMDSIPQSDAPAPMSFTTAPVPTTSTGKPQRREISRQMSCIYYRNTQWYKNMLAISLHYARKVVHNLRGLESASDGLSEKDAIYVIARDAKIRAIRKSATEFCISNRHIPDLDITDLPHVPIDRSMGIESLKEWMSKLAAVTGHIGSAIRGDHDVDGDVASYTAEALKLALTKPLWNSIMHDTMGDYGKLVRDTIDDLCVNTADLNMLEVGMGVRNTKPVPCRSLARTDIYSGMIKFGQRPDRVMENYGEFVLDVDHLACEDGESIGDKLANEALTALHLHCLSISTSEEDDEGVPFYKRLDVIYGTNVMHCATNPEASLRGMAQLLNTGGLIVLGEGQRMRANPVTNSNAGWPLDWCFMSMDGWWNKGQFRTRAYWMSALIKAGAKQVGYNVIRCGTNDLGGVVWGRF